MTVRIIPHLDIKGPNLVKSTHLEGLRVLGKPEHFAHYYYEQGADEMGSTSAMSKVVSVRFYGSARGILLAGLPVAARLSIQRKDLPYETLA